MGEEMKIILGELQKINGRLDGMDKRFDTIEEQLVGMDKRFDEVDRRFEDVDKRFEDVDKRFDEVDRRFEDVDKRFDEVDRRFEDVDKHFEEVSGRFDIVDEKINVMYNESTHEFGAVRQELQTVHNMLSERINDIDALTTQNCRDITRLRAIRHA